ncbi:hypothetical protein [Streptomyces fuscichromogenes]|uniref:hypothetical protein n=1 Tax=Streptomyces fuscichromogenes TaxID=1324013 RepID=UPI001E559F2B|nr:hypothetical protein [Streptomyces fuscichromogenes]
MAATHVVVRQADVGTAGVAGGSQQTALNVGPALGVAVAGALMGSGTGEPLLAMAFLAVLGVAAARWLPGASSIASVTPHVDERDRSPHPARR